MKVVSLKQGDRFNKWTVIRFDKIKNTRKYYLCKCDCGNIRSVSGSALSNNETGSCGCSVRTKSGLQKKDSHSSWREMIRRCTDPTSLSYPRYGGVGITVCDEWFDFFKFYSDMGDRPYGMSLDRVNNLLGYSKENCKWSSNKEQARNRKNNIIFFYEGKNRSLAEISEMCLVPYKYLYYRVCQGMDIHDIIYEYNPNKVQEVK